MLGAALSALSDRLDSKFLTAYWLTAFVAVFGGFGILAVLVGPSRMEEWVFALDSVEQTLAVLIVVLAISILAFVLRAVSRPVVEVFAGIALPRAVAEWSTRGQLKVKQRAAAALVPAAAPPDSVETQQARDWLKRVYPLDDSETNRPCSATSWRRRSSTRGWRTRWRGFCGGPAWRRWSRGRSTTCWAAAQAPMMALLNLCVVFAALALGGAPVLALAGGHWLVAVVVLIGGLLLARLCYRTAVSQAAELGSLLRVGFDLYCHEILRQMDMEVPTDLDSERAVWDRLTAQVIGLPLAPPDGGAAPATPAADQDASAKAKTPA